MDKFYGVSERNDSLRQIGASKWALTFGAGEDVNGRFAWYKVYGHKPTREEAKNDICEQVNANVAEKILRGLEWDGKPVWLSDENQRNFKTTFDIALNSEGHSLPVRFKLGENENGESVYHVFEDLLSFAGFHSKWTNHIYDCLNEGWEEKDSIDWSKFGL